MNSNPNEPTKAVDAGDGPRTPDAYAPLPGCVRFFLHMMVASVLAPAVGVAVLVFCTSDWPIWYFPLMFVGSLVFGVLALVFIWFVTVPFGLITYGLCVVARNVGVTNRLIWAFVGMLAGLGFGWSMSHSPDFPRALLCVSGSGIGLASGLVLWKLWHMDRAEGMETKPQEISKTSPPQTPPAADAAWRLNTSPGPPRTRARLCSPPWRWIIEEVRPESLRAGRREPPADPLLKELRWPCAILFPKPNRSCEAGHCC